MCPKLQQNYNFYTVQVSHPVNIIINHLTYFRWLSSSDNGVILSCCNPHIWKKVEDLFWADIQRPNTHQSVVKCKDKQQLVSIHSNIKNPNQVCELSTTVLITMLISTSLRCLSLPTNASSAAKCVKEQSVWGTNTPFTSKAYVSWGYVWECVLNVNGKMRIILYSPGLGVFPHCVFFNAIVSRLLLFVTAARGASLPDSDADQGAMGRPGAGGEIRACKIPHTHCLEVRLYTFIHIHTRLLHTNGCTYIDSSWPFFFPLSPFYFVSPANRFWVGKQEQHQYIKSPSRLMSQMDLSHCKYLMNLHSLPVTPN